MAVLELIVNFLIAFTFWVGDAFQGTASFASVPSVSQTLPLLTPTIPCDCFATTNVPNSELAHWKLSRTHFAIIIRGENLINHMHLYSTAKSDTEVCLSNHSEEGPNTDNANSIYIQATGLVNIR